jgi:agmatine deiminase
VTSLRDHCIWQSDFFPFLSLEGLVHSSFLDEQTKRVPMFLLRKTKKKFRRLEIPNDVPFLTMPSEEDLHEGTWLQWPHDYHHCDGGRRMAPRPFDGSSMSRQRVRRYEDIWIQMTQALHTGERVHIIVYNDREKDRVRKRLLAITTATAAATNRGNTIDLSRIDFYVWPTNDVWIRDSGPIFCFDNEQDRLAVTNWKFNGWGNKVPDWKLDNQIPTHVASQLGLPIINVPMVNEGGSIELDGRGTLMAKASSILNRNRNPGWTRADAEECFRRYLGVTNFIWLDGKKGGGDITDDHIDGTARFAGGDTIVTFHRSDFLNPREYDVLKQATNADGERYKMVHLPVTKEKQIRGEPGIYINYYVANAVVILPIFDDPSDVVATNILQELYPTREIVAVNMTEVYKDGGLAHCVTQQQPAIRYSSKK